MRMSQGYRRQSTVAVAALLALLSLTVSACSGASTSAASTDPNGHVTVHLGYFPNVTHAVALVGVQRGALTSLGSNVTVDTKTFNAGPALIEALLAGDIDIGYVGPSPAINGYVKSHGEALRIIAGAASGGAAFVVRPGAHITTAADLAGKKIATPQKGNTQDIALRYYLQQNHLKPTEDGGTVQVVPTDNANILTLFKAGQIDGAWVAEPYVSRLVVEDKGTVLVDERTLWPNGKFVSTNVVARKAFLDQHPDVVKAFLKAHVETVQYIQANLASAKTIANGELQRLSGKALAPAVIDSAFANVDVTYDPLAQSLLTSADHAYALGFLGETKPDLSGIYALKPLNDVLSAKGLAPVAGL
ncbi:MAG: ABC transporter substrate-binding protein [Ktedonobacterales bacterium]